MKIIININKKFIYLLSLILIVGLVTGATTIGNDISTFTGSFQGGDIGVSNMTARNITVTGLNTNSTILGDLIIQRKIFGDGSLPLQAGGGLNLTTGALYLWEDYSIQPGSPIVRRQSSTGAIFGLMNTQAGTGADSGVSYVWSSDAGNYTIDLHSTTDPNNPSEIIHHINVGINGEVWRLNSEADGGFRFERALGNSIIDINVTKSEFVIDANITTNGNFTVTHYDDSTNSNCGWHSNGSIGCRISDGGVRFTS